MINSNTKTRRVICAIDLVTSDNGDDLSWDRARRNTDLLRAVGATGGKLVLCKVGHGMTSSATACVVFHPCEFNDDAMMKVELDLQSAGVALCPSGFVSEVSADSVDEWIGRQTWITRSPRQRIVCQ